MGKKAKRDHTSEQPPLDDDVHWMPLVEAVPRLIKQTASMQLALPDLEDAQESRKLPSMRRDLTTGEREPLQPEFWKENIIYYEEEAGGPYVNVFPGPKDKRRWNIWDRRDEDGSYVYFVSRPHFERLWPAQQQQQAEPPPNSEEPSDGRQVARLKEVLSVVYRDGVPANTTDKEVLARVGPEYKKLGWGLPKRDTIARALGRRK